MSKQLYEEAIADLKKVKEIAEDNAKRAIVEAVAPRIRELIEKELLGESVEELEKISDEHPEENEMHHKMHPEEAKKDEPEPTIDPKTGMPVITSAMKEDEMKEVSFAELTQNESANVDLDTTLKSVDEMKQRLLYVEKTLQNISNQGNSVTESIDVTLSQLDDAIDSVYGYMQENVEDPTARLGYGLKIRKCLEKIEKLQETTMKKDLLGEEKVRIELDLPGVELGEMEDAAVELVLDEEESEGEEEMEMSAEPEAEAGEEEAPEAVEPEAAAPVEDEGLLEVLNLDDDAVVEIDESMLRREIAAMKLLREVEEDKNAEEGHAPGAKEFDDFGGAKEEGEALDMDITEAYGMDELDMVEYDLDEVDHPAATGEAAKAADPSSTEPPDGGAAANMKEEDLSEDEMNEMERLGQAKDVGEYNTMHKGVQTRQPANESVRSKMARELKLQESLRKRASQLKKVYEATKKAASQSSTLLERKEATSRSTEIKAAYTKTAESYNASVARFNKLSQSLSEGAVKSNVSNSVAKSGASADQIDMLSKKLAETNLFNAKLLFTNKLLQTESLTSRQKAQVIEQLDAAQTIREAKLVYESLAKALVKPRKTVTESRVLGSSSQATRPASTQTLSEGVESERWARLAGIK